jgi:ubiquinone/menaquinone biosynthesis C-methylase UbiE
VTESDSGIDGGGAARASLNGSGPEKVAPDWRGPEEGIVTNLPDRGGEPPAGGDSRPPDHYRGIYSTRAAEYHRMIAAEDADGRLLPALAAEAPLPGARILDIGTGTGRIPLLLRELARSIVALDRHRPMLLENARQRERVGGRWSLVEADARDLPLGDGMFDVAIAGWTLGHFCGWYPEDWTAQADRALAEMRRVVVPGGSLVILETLGTGAASPAPPRPALAGFYHRLETTWGFRRRVVPTDYVFDSPADAAAAMGFFFGESMAERIRSAGWSRVPEWTGLWSLGR